VREGGEEEGAGGREGLVCLLFICCAARLKGLHRKEDFSLVMSDLRDTKRRTRA